MPITDAVEWISPAACAPPHRISHPEKLDELREAFGRDGWDPNQPALIGYRMNVGVQLLSGSHRWRAAVESGLKRIPVVCREWGDCYSAFGNLSRWRRLMAAPPAGRAQDKEPDHGG